MTRIFNIKRVKLTGLLFLILFTFGCAEEPPSDAQLLLAKIADQNRFISADDLAKRIINDDPSIRLIDLRSAYEFEQYSLPDAVNIPMDALLKEENLKNFQEEGRSLILFSNSAILSDQAWVLLDQKGYSNSLVLKGGLNEWFSTIMLPDKPLEGEPDEAFDLYTFRKGASLYFGGSVQEIPVAVDKNTKVEKKVEKKKKEVIVKEKVKKATEGGC
jgi:rhodanese-related sulfurtransferase